ncbi:DUF1501 domain-containing protein [Planctomycetaceae bacterium SH139]
MNRLFVAPISEPSRREFLRVGSLLGTGLTLPNLLSSTTPALADGSSTAVAKSCIFIWLDGGPSHLDTFDPKPAAPAEVRGPFSAIQTNIPGLWISELFPRLAQRMDRLAVIRSLTSPLGEHNLGAQYLLTGYQPSPVIEHPSFTSVMASQFSKQALVDDQSRGATKASRNNPLPPSVAIPNHRIGGSKLNAAGFLPAQFAPFSVDSDPSKADFSVRNLEFSQGDIGRLQRRQRYRQWLAEEQILDPLAQQAFSLLQSSAARQAFNLDAESVETRRRYGSKTIGQSCLLARRLITAGVRLVSVVDHGWDTHLDLITRLRDGYTGAKVPVGLGPSLDMALTALLDDLEASGQLNETLVVVMGEFGRTPKWNTGGGRDHWPRVFSALLAGGPIQVGSVLGASDQQGESPHERPVTPADLAHTLYAAMGIDPRQTIMTPDARPITLGHPEATAISELL